MQETDARSSMNWNLDLSEDRLISRIRVILGVSALTVTAIDPSEPNRFVLLTYAVLGAYVFYGFALYWKSIRLNQPKDPRQVWLHWVDGGFYVILVGLSGGTNSIFYNLFFFVILVASFRLGFRPGIHVSVVLLVLFLAVGYWARPPGPEFDLNRLLLRAVSLPVLGYMIAYWGGYELRLKRSLAFLKEVSALSNPRFGADRTFADNLEQIRAFFEADSCLAVTHTAGEDSYQIRRASPSRSSAPNPAEEISSDLAGKLLGFPEKEVITFSKSAKRRWRRNAERFRPDGADDSSQRYAFRIQAAELLEAGSFLSVPLRSRNQTGRIYVTRRKPPFGIEDADFLLQVVDQMMPVLENIRLVDHMASQAAEEERKRIARDIHDRIIQPYIGLKFGITSMRQVFDTSPDDRIIPILRERTDRLLDLTDTGIAELRDYVARLKYGGASGSALVDSLRRFATRFSEVTGIQIDVEAGSGFTVNDRLAAEVLAMVTEGISNIQRHTRAERGSVELRSTYDRLFLVIRNERTPGLAPEPFVHRSISDRADSLQGTVRVEFSEEGETAVHVQIPL